MRRTAAIALFGALAAAIVLQCAPRERPVAPERLAASPPVATGASPAASPRDTRVGSTKLSCLRPGLDEELHRCTKLPNPPVAYGEVWSRLDALSRARRPLAPKGGAARPLTREETAFLDAAREYLCAEKDPRSGRLDLAFERGRVYFEAAHFAEAAVFLRDALLHDDDGAAQAAQLLLQSLDALAATTPSCVATMRELMPVVLARVCGRGTDGTEACDTLRRVDADLGRLP